MRRGNIYVSQEEFEAMEAADREEINTLTLEQSVQELAALVRKNSGASDAAKSVLLHMWNPKWPIIELQLLDDLNHAAAMKVLAARWMEDRALKKMVPDIQDWAIEAENE